MVEVSNCSFVVGIVLDVFEEEVVDTKLVSLNAVVCFPLIVAIFLVSWFCSVMVDDVGEEIEDMFSEGCLDLLLVIEGKVIVVVDDGTDEVVDILSEGWLDWLVATDGWIIVDVVE